MISSDENICDKENCVVNTSSSSSSSFGSGYVVNRFYDQPFQALGDEQGREKSLQETVLSIPLDKNDPSSEEDEGILVCSTTDSDDDVWESKSRLCRYRLPTDEEYVVSIGEGLLLCADCGYTNISPQTMKQHLIRKHNLDIVHGESPTTIKKQETEVTDDIESFIYTLTGNLLMCAGCGITFTRRQHIVNHALVHLDIPPEKWDDCGKLYKNINCLYVHYHRKHGLKKDKKQTFKKPKKQGLIKKDRWSTKLNVVKEGDKESVLCTFCQKSYKDRRSLRSHYVLYHKEQKHKWYDISCNVCGVTCNGKLDLHRHKREKHKKSDQKSSKKSKVRKLKIEFNEEIESRISQLLDYQENEEFEELSGYFCKEPGCDFSHKFICLARRHVVNHLDLPRTHCKRCDKSFKHIYYLKAHMSVCKKD